MQNKVKVKKLSYLVRQIVTYKKPLKAMDWKNLYTLIMKLATQMYY